MFRLLAVDPGTIIFALFALFSVGASVIKQLSGEKEEPRKNQPRRPRNPQVQREIDEFLQRQTGGNPNRPVEVSPDDIEVVDEKPRRRQAPPPRPTKANRQSQRQPSPPKPAQQRPASVPPGDSPQSRRPVGTSNLGSGLREHVSTVMAERVGAQVTRDLPHLASSVNQQVQQDLGNFNVSTNSRSDLAAQTASNWVQLLRNPESARQAVLMSEILGRPRALRK